MTKRQMRQMKNKSKNQRAMAIVKDMAKNPNKYSQERGLVFTDSGVGAKNPNRVKSMKTIKKLLFLGLN